QAGQAAQEDRRRGQRSLFEMFAAPETNGHGNGNGNGAGKAVGLGLSLPDVPELPDVERLAEEKKVLGFYMSSHPLTRHAPVLPALATHRAADLGASSVSERTEVILGGMIVGVQVRNVQKSRSGHTRMAKLTFEDLSGSVPAMLWPEEFARFEDLVKSDQLVF